jgi:hypothetical protein
MIGVVGYVAIQALSTNRQLGVVVQAELVIQRKVRLWHYWHVRAATSALAHPIRNRLTCRAADTAHRGCSRGTAVAETSGLIDSIAIRAGRPA